MRDLKADLELCQSHRQKRWKFQEWVDAVGQQWYGVSDDGHGFCRVRDKKIAEFIVQAREGWPHAIERALEAEAKLEKAKDLIQRWFDGEIGAFGVMDTMIIDLEFDIDGIPDEALEYHNIKRKEVLVDEA